MSTHIRIDRHPESPPLYRSINQIDKSLTINDQRCTIKEKSQTELSRSTERRQPPITADVITDKIIGRRETTEPGKTKANANVTYNSADILSATLSGATARGSL